MLIRSGSVLSLKDDPRGESRRKGTQKNKPLPKVRTNDIAIRRRCPGCPGGVLGGFQMLEEGAHSRSLHFTDVQKAMMASHFENFTKRACARGPSPLGGSCLDKYYALDVTETPRRP